MKKQRRVFLYGRSVILGTVGASLSSYADLEIIPLTPPLPDLQELRALAPEVILYDINAGRPEAALNLLETCPELLLIGVNPDTNQVLVWSGRHLSELSTQDLVKVITQSSPDAQSSQGTVNE